MVGGDLLRRVIACVVAALFLCGPASANQGRPAARDDRPNVLFISIDDLRPELGAYGARHIRSPNIDAFARRSLRFDRAYVQQAVCNPSRASLLTGLRPDANGITNNSTRLREHVPAVVTLPQHFKAHGYHTVNFGKVFHWNDAASWSERPWAPPQLFTNNMRGYLSWRNMRLMGNRNHPAEQKNAPSRGSFWEAEDVPDNAYPDGLTVEKAIDVMYRLKGRERPFFLAVGLDRPHLPFAAPKRYWDLYDRERIALPPDYRRMPAATRYSGSNWLDFAYYLDSPTPETITEDQVKLAIHGYYACISYADALVGKLLRALDEQGLRENTIVVLWGDHGFHLGERFMWSKGTNYELDTRAPLMIAAPGMASAGRSTRALVEFVDIYPTLAGLAGLPKPSHLQGDDLRPLFERPGGSVKRAAFSQYPREGGAVMGYSMRTDRYRYTLWRDRKTGRVLARELYDHRTDPRENVNLAADPESGGVRARLDRMFEAEFARAYRRAFDAGAAMK